MQRRSILADFITTREDTTPLLAPPTTTRSMVSVSKKVEDMFLEFLGQLCHEDRESLSCIPRATIRVQEENNSSILKSPELARTDLCEYINSIVQTLKVSDFSDRQSKINALDLIEKIQTLSPPRTVQFQTYKVVRRTSAPFDHENATVLNPSPTYTSFGSLEKDEPCCKSCTLS